MSYLDQITVGSTTYDLQDSGAQRVTLIGASAPTTSTVGVVGQHYINTSATSHPYEYVCTAVSSGTYTWIPVDSSDAPVTSVNSKTGAVVLDKTDIGLGNVANVAQYSASNPPPYPVTSVNGSTGAVTVSVPSAATATPSNLGTAAVGTSTKYAKEDHVHKMPTASDVGALPSSTSIPSKTSDLTNDSGFITSSSLPVAATETPEDLGTATIGTSTKYAREDHVHTKPTYSKSDVGLGNVDNVKQYSASNPPPYPVTSVNGNTGAVTVVEDDKTWNGVTLNKSYGASNSNYYIPAIESGSVSDTTARFTLATTSPTTNAIPKYNVDSYLISTTPPANDNSTRVATTAYVDSAIDDLPEPMVFKGSLGTGGTVSTLPAAATSNTGFTYKVITDGTYASQDAKVGDTFISDGTAWVLIPSGDEPSGTVTSVGVSNATNGGLSVSGSPITSSGTISIGHSNVLSSAQTTQAVYPIKIDKNGHISAYGSAVSIPSKTSDLTNDSGFITSASVPAAATETPSDLGTAAIGTSTKYAREDHVHTKPTYSKSDVGLGNVDNVKQYSASNPPPYPVTSVNGNTGAVTVVEDDHKWAGVTLGASGANTAANAYVPSVSTMGNTSGTAYWATVSSTPTAYVIAKYDGDKYLYSTTPATSDNSSKVATTSFVKSSLPTKVSDLTNDSGFLTSSGAVTSFNGSTGAVTYTAPVTSVNGETGAVTITDSDEKLKTDSLPDATDEYVLLGPASTTAGNKYYTTGMSFRSRSDEKTDRLTIGVSGNSSSTTRRSGQIALYNQDKYCIIRNSSTTNSGYYINVPASGGTLALSSEIPTKVSDLTNDSAFVDATGAAAAAPVQSVNGSTGAVTVSVPSASSATPQALGTAAAGTSTDYSRADHVHAKPTYSKSDVGLGNVDNVQQYSASNPPPYPVTSVNGKTGAVTVAEDDKTWGGIELDDSVANVAADSYVPFLYSDDTAKWTTASSTPANYKIAKYANGGYLKSTTPSARDNSTKVATTAYVDSALPEAATATPSNLGTAAVGTSSKYAKEDHVHNYPDVVHVGSSAPSDSNIELWLDNSSGGNSVVSSVDGKTGTVTVLPSGGTTGQVLKKVSGTSYDVTWANESGSVTSVNGQTGDVTVPTVAIQDTTPTGGELLWVDTDEPGVNVTIPQIDDNNVSSDDTWSSQKIRDFIYPVGSIYMSVNSISPATIFGGTWEQLEDRFLLGAGQTYTAGDTGGAATHTHTTGDHTLTIYEIPSHNHSMALANTDASLSSYARFGYNGEAFRGNTGNSGGGQAHNHGDTGSSSNLPPYLVVYMWERTA